MIDHFLRQFHDNMSICNTLNVLSEGCAYNHFSAEGMGTHLLYMAYYL